MSDFSSWSLQLGRWRGVQIRVHAIFLLVAVFALYLSTHRPGQEQAGYGLLSLAVLLVSVLAHELGHFLAAARVGGNGDQILIGPLGGLAPLHLPREPQPELITALAGPLVNLGVLLLALPIAIATHTSLLPLISPFQPTELLTGAWWVVLLKLTFWTNWLLLVVNLLPAFPLDGARILRAMLWPALDYRTATAVVIRTTKLTALAACLVAWAVHDPQADLGLPTWVPLVLFAVFVFFSAQHESARLDENEWGDELYSYDFSQGYTSLERTLDPPQRSGGSVRRWLESRRELRRRKRESRELEEERQVDGILVRLHESGMQGLTAKERAILNRVSARYRNRQSN